MKNQEGAGSYGPATEAVEGAPTRQLPAAGRDLPPAPMSHSMERAELLCPDIRWRVGAAMSIVGEIGLALTVLLFVLGAVWFMLFTT